MVPLKKVASVSLPFEESTLRDYFGNCADLPAVTKRFIELSSSGYVMPFSSLALGEGSVDGSTNFNFMKF